MKKIVLLITKTLLYNNLFNDFSFKKDYDLTMCGISGLYLKKTFLIKIKLKIVWN